MGMQQDDVRYLDLMPGVPLIGDPAVIDCYADAIGSLERVGQNFRATYVTLSRINGILRRTVVCKVVRPRSSLLNQFGISAAMDGGIEAFQQMRKVH